MSKDTKILNLNNPIGLSNDNLQNNLINLEKIYGNSFYIKWNNMNLLFHLDKNIHEPFFFHTNKTKFYNNIKFYRLRFYIDYDNKYSDSINDLPKNNPLVIDFIDPITLKLNDNCCLEYLYETDDYSDKELINLGFELCKKLKVKKMITADHDNKYLSMLNFIENNKTYYMEFGFKIEKFFNSVFQDYVKKQTILKLMNKYVDKIRLIKTSKMIYEYKKIIKILKKVKKNPYGEESDLELFNILYDGFNSNLECMNLYNYEKRYVKYVSKMLNTTKSILNILQKYKDKYLYQILVKLSNENDYRDYRKLADKYTEFTILINEFIYYDEISYNNIKIERKYFKYFKNLSGLIKNTFYSYNFT